MRPLSFNTNNLKKSQRTLFLQVLNLGDELLRVYDKNNVHNFKMNSPMTYIRRNGRRAGEVV